MKLTEQNIQDLIYVLNHNADISKQQKATVSASLNAEMCENELNPDSDLSNDATLYDFDNVSDVKPGSVYNVIYEDRVNNIMVNQTNLSESDMLKCVHNLAKLIRNKQGD